MIVSLVRPSKHIVRPALILVLLTSILTLMAETTFGHSTDQESPGGSVYPQAVDGDPVDLATGLYMLEEQDFVFPDWIPILLTRVYRSRDSGMRAFGLGASHSFEIYLLRNDLCSEIRLILPDGAYIQYKRQAGTNCLDSVLTHKGTPTVFYNSSLSWKPDEFRWILQREDGVSFRFNDFLVLTEVQNAQGHRLTVGRDPSQRVVSITSPCGCWLKFVRDNQGKIVRIEDFLGRRANYEYDARGRLSRVEYPGQKRVSLYTYDSEDRMISIGDENGPYFWNDYDEHGKVVTQRHPDGTKYQFRYVVTDTGETRQTIVKTRTGEVRIATFNDAGRIVSDTWDAEGARSRTSQYKWDTESNQLQGVMIQDALESKREGSALHGQDEPRKHDERPEKIAADYRVRNHLAGQITDAGLAALAKPCEPTSPHGTLQSRKLMTRDEIQNLWGELAKQESYQTILFHNQGSTEPSTAEYNTAHRIVVEDRRAGYLRGLFGFSSGGGWRIEGHLASEVPIEGGLWQLYAKQVTEWSPSLGEIVPPNPKGGPSWEFQLLLRNPMNRNEVRELKLVQLPANIVTPGMVPQGLLLYDPTRHMVSITIRGLTTPMRYDVPIVPSFQFYKFSGPEAPKYQSPPPPAQDKVLEG